LIALGCKLARMSNVEVPQWIRDDPNRIAEVFRDASSGDIEITVDLAPLAATQGVEQSVYAYYLHKAVATLCANVPGEKCRSVAVLFAGEYAPHPSAFGLMFDRGFSTPDDPNNATEIIRTPREGCAVFLDAIAALRPDQPDFERESEFVTFHELGHVFNLQHRDMPPNYLAVSKSSEPYDATAFDFDKDDKTILAACSTTRETWPGGAPFGDTSTHSNEDLPVRKREPFGLDLRIAMAQREFWRFEPVELDLEIAVSPAVTQSFTIPDAVDPSQRAFRLWIEEPSGERRIYRSPERCCGPTKRRRVSPGSPFQRDITLFGEAGGYTFRRAGEHKVWAELFMPQGTLRSNTLTINVKRESREGPLDLARARLTDGHAAQLLFHKLLIGSTETAEALIDLNLAAPEIPSLGSVNLSVGRALMRRAEAAEAEDDALAWLTQATAPLNYAADHPRMGLCQRRKAESLQKACARKVGRMLRTTSARRTEPSEKSRQAKRRR
jgi:hypothetical protein